MSNPIRRSAAPATDVDVAAFEAAVGHPLPADYRASLLAANGGVPRRKGFRYTLPSGKSRAGSVAAFAPLGADGWVEVDCRPLAELWAADGGELIDGTVAVGRGETDVNGGTIRVGVAGDAVGRVVFRPDDTAKGQVYPVAASWDEFLAGLKQRDKPDPWDEPIEDGDVDLLKRWMKQYTRKWDHSAVTRKAVEENRVAVLEMAVAEFEFEPASIVDEALDQHRLGLAFHFLSGLGETDALRGALCRPGPFLWHAPPLVAALLAAGADPTEEKGDGLTPLHHAARAGGADAVRLLLDKGADPTLTDDEGRTPRDHAEQAEAAEVAATLREAEAARPAESDDPVRPFDLCAVRFARAGKPITLAEIQAAEAEWKLSFPPEYRWLLLQANGAVLDPGLLPETVLPTLYVTEDDDDEGGDGHEPQDEGPDVRLDLFPLRKRDCVYERRGPGDDGPSLAYSAEEAKGWYHDGSEMPRGFLPIGNLDGYGCDGTGFLLIGCRGPKRGRLFAFDHGESPLGVTLPELFAKLGEAGERPQSPAEQLADAVAADDLDAVRAAVAAGAAKTWMTRDGRIPLREACAKGFDAAVLAIGEAGDRDQAITEALGAGRVAVARALFDGAAKVKRDTLETMLYSPALYADPDFLAAVAGRWPKLDKLLNPKDGGSLLEVAAASGSVAGLRFLIERGGRVDRVDREDGTTLLFDAVRDPEVGAGPMIAFLLESGVSLIAGDAQGHTALHAAIKADNPAAAKALIDAGADLDFRAVKNNPMMQDPRTQKMLARAEKEMEKLARELERDVPAGDFADEDAPVLDPDEPAAKDALEVQNLATQMQKAMGAMMPRLQERVLEQQSDLGPPAADLAARWPYLHIPPLIAELRAYAAGKPATSPPGPLSEAERG